jgi:hypothetical protein
MVVTWHLNLLVLTQHNVIPFSFPAHGHPAYSYNVGMDRRGPGDSQYRARATEEMESEPRSAGPVFTGQSKPGEGSYDPQG